ncbi:hypothetical protein L083_7967 [Actinoplanes sp. N902-109]|nr:hypothetical protein L083_7967 [Actinoplanes sp. N902-109]
MGGQLVARSHRDWMDLVDVWMSLGPAHIVKAKLAETVVQRWFTV